MQRTVGTQRALHGSRVGAAVRGCAGSIARVGGSARCAGRAGRPRGRGDGGAAPDGILAAVLRDDPFRRALRTRTCLAARSPTLSMVRARGEGAARPRVSNHEATYALFVTRNGQDARGYPGIPSRPVSSRPSWVAVSNPSHSRGLLRAIGCEYTAAADLIDEFVTAPRERRLLR